jgi:hypothetical protein
LKITRRGYWEVRRGPYLVSRHTTDIEAFESASRNLPAVVVPPTFDVAADVAPPKPSFNFGLPSIRLAAA